MAFPFVKDIEYKKYSKTFLKKVLVGVMFDENICDKENEIEESWHKYLNDLFSIEGDASNLKGEPVQVKEIDGNLNFLFSESFSYVIVDTHDYSSFIESILPQIFKLKLFGENVLKVEHYKKLTVRMTNVWLDKLPEDISEGEFKKQILSKNILNLDTNTELEDIEKNLPNVMKHQWESDDVKVEAMITYDFNEHNMQYGLALDTTAEFQFDNSPKPLRDIIDNSLKLHDILYQLFHWCITENTLKIMEGE